MFSRKEQDKIVETVKRQLDGYFAKLDAGLILTSQLGSGIASSSKVLAGDRTWARPSAGEAFPIGAVYLNVTGVNPATELGYGTWSQIAQGKFLVGQDPADTDFDVAEETGGAKTHNLTVAEMPAHTHQQMRHAKTTGALSGITTAPDASSSDPQTLGPVTGSTGGGGAHNNLPPYYVVYLWRRDS